MTDSLPQRNYKTGPHFIVETSLPTLYADVLAEREVKLVPVAPQNFTQ